jgi:hypothetical protein
MIQSLTAQSIRPGDQASRHGSPDGHNRGRTGAVYRRRLKEPASAYAVSMAGIDLVTGAFSYTGRRVAQRLLARELLRCGLWSPALCRRWSSETCGI